MALRHAPLCNRCNQLRTKHPSGECSRCRRILPPTFCRLCGNKTQFRYGLELCHDCRKKFPSPLNIEAAIAKQEQYLNILKLRQKKLPFDMIAKEVGLSKTAVYDAYRRLMHVPDRVPMDHISAIEAHFHNDDEKK